MNPQYFKDFSDELFNDLKLRTWKNHLALYEPEELKEMERQRKNKKQAEERLLDLIREH